MSGYLDHQKPDSIFFFLGILIAIPSGLFSIVSYIDLGMCGISPCLFIFDFDIFYRVTLMFVGSVFFLVSGIFWFGYIIMVIKHKSYMRTMETVIKCQCGCERIFENDAKLRLHSISVGKAQ